MCKPVPRSNLAGCTVWILSNTLKSSAVRIQAGDMTAARIILVAQADDLDEILAWREERTVTHNLTLHYDRMMLLPDPTPCQGSHFGAESHPAVVL
jgi:hypothetical protein